MITGGSEGIGLGMAKAFAAQWAYVYLIGRTLGKLETAENIIIAQGWHVESRSADITDADGIKEVVDDVYKDKGRLDIFINNAGGRAKHDLEAPLRDIWKMVELDMRAPYEITQNLVNRFKKEEKNELKILTVISQAALEFMDSSLGYGAAKMWLTAGLFHIENEMKKEGITNVELYRLYPDTVATDNMLLNLGENAIPDSVSVEAVADTALALLLDETPTRDVRIGYYPGKWIVRSFYPSTASEFYCPPKLSEEVIDAKFNPQNIVIPEPAEARRY